MTDKRIVKISSASVLAVLLIAFLVPLGESGRIVAALLLLPAAVFIPIFIKKRNILSINKNQVLLIVSVIALLYVMACYLTGLKFGFYKNSYGLSLNNFFRFFLPVASIIVFSEIVRYVLIAQNDKLSNVLCYFSCVVADMLICSNIPAVTSMSRFMELIAGAFFTAIISNLLYNYLSKRYGVYPNLAFRAITVLYAYTLPIVPAISDAILNFFNILLPIAVYLFIDALYEKKRKYALGNKSVFVKILSVVLTVTVLTIMLGTVMLVSNQFKYGAYVIATPSMTGELNQGDVALYEQLEDRPVEEGEVIVFEKDGTVIVHRVEKIETINGITRYYTKGDANEDIDAGYISRSDIIGHVNFKIPYIGFPTLWMRNLFK